jgi:hypothetical protein
MEKDTRAAPQPADLLGVIDDAKRQRILILDPLEGGTQRRESELVARTTCEITFHKEDALQACIRALRESDEQLKLRPDSLKMWEWTRTYREGMDIIFGVLWYDRAFFEARKDVWKDPKHAGFYREFGASPADFRVSHEVLQPLPD